MLHKLIKDKIISCIEVFPHSQLPLIFQDTNRQINPNYNGKLYFNILSPYDDIARKTWTSLRKTCGH